MFMGTGTNDTTRVIAVPGGKGKKIQWSAVDSTDYSDVQVKEHIYLSCKNSEELMAKILTYCAQHNLSFRDDRNVSDPEDICVTITTMPTPYHPRSKSAAQPKDNASPGPAFAAKLCPLCGGRLVKAVSVKDDTNKPSKNMEIWNRSICLNPRYNDEAVICTQCWLSFSPGWSEAWERCSELPDSFRYPLSETLRHFPVPVESGAYTQRFIAGQTNDTTHVLPLPGGSGKETKWRVIHSLEYSNVMVEESTHFWCKDFKELMTKFHGHCTRHEFSMEEDRAKSYPGEVHVTITTKLMPYQPRSAAAVKPKGNKP